MICPSNPSAANKTINIPELQRWILIYLDPWTMLHAQRVSKDFNATIRSSEDCQRALFFLPEETTLIADEEGEAKPAPLDPSSTIFNPLLEHYFANWFNDTKITVQSIDGLLPFSDQKRKDAFLRSEASWRRMLVTQPPVNMVRIYHRLTRGRPRGHNLRRGIVQTHEGCHFNTDSSPSSDSGEIGALHMSTLFDLTEEFIGTNSHDSTVHCTWHMRTDPRFRDAVPFSNTNALHIFACDVRSGIRFVLEDDTASKALFSLVGVRMNDKWSVDYRSKGFREVKVLWQAEKFDAFTQVKSNEGAQGDAAFKRIRTCGTVT